MPALVVLNMHQTARKRLDSLRLFEHFGVPLLQFPRATMHFGFQALCELAKTIFRLINRIACPHLVRDISEIADHAESTLRQRNSVHPPFVVFGGITIDPALDSFRSLKRLAGA